MANIRVKESEKSKTRTVCMTDKELRKIKKLTKEKSLTRAVRKLVELAESE